MEPNTKIKFDIAPSGYSKNGVFRNCSDNRILFYATDFIGRKLIVTFHKFSKFSIEPSNLLFSLPESFNRE